MKTQKVCFLCGLILFIATFTASCTQTTPAYQTPAYSPTPSRVVNTVTPISTLTPSLTNTPTAVSTLPADVAHARLLDLLANNTCEFPCLWGIRPGITGLNEVENLNRFSIFSDGGGVFSERGGRLFLRVPQPNSTLINLSVEVDMVNGVVDQTFFGTQVVREIENGYEWVTDDPLYPQVRKGFSLSRILSQYGEPAEVYLFTMKFVPMGHPWNFPDSAGICG